MEFTPDLPDPSLYIEKLSAEDACSREAAAWTLGAIGSPRAARPLAGLFLRELESVETAGYLRHDEVVVAVVEAIRRLGATEALYALIKGVCVMGRAKILDEDTLTEIVDAIGEVGGPNAVREVADRVVRCAREGACGPCMETVARVLLPRLELCGDHAESTLRRLALNGPDPLAPIARELVAV